MGYCLFLLNFYHMPLKGDREALVRKKTEIRDKEVCDSREDSEMLNWAPRDVLKSFFLKELTEVFKNITDFPVCCCPRVLYREKRWVGWVILQSLLALHGTG